MMTCEQCKKRGKTWRGDDPKCAFLGDLWSDENWNCASDGLLREIALDGDNPKIWHDRYDDQNVACISLIGVDGVADAYSIWMTWYKSRGRTENVLLLFSGGQPRPPSEIELMAVVRHYRPNFDTPQE